MGLWVSGRRSLKLLQIHRHIGDLPLVIPQKHGEQRRRDAYWGKRSKIVQTEETALYGLEFYQPIMFPWIHLVNDREIKESFESLLSFCSGVAAMEVCNEQSLNLEIFLHGGCFSLPLDCFRKPVMDILPELSERSRSCSTPRSGEVFLTISLDEEFNGISRRLNLVRKKDAVHVRRTAVLHLPMGNRLTFTELDVSHCEADTRFVCAYNQFEASVLCIEGCNIGEDRKLKTGDGIECTMIVLSKNTYATLISGLSDILEGNGLLHVLGDNIVNIDVMRRIFKNVGLEMTFLAVVYVIAGCDFTARTSGVSHLHYVNAAVKPQKWVGLTTPGRLIEVCELLALFTYLGKHGKYEMNTCAQHDILRAKWARDAVPSNEISWRAKRMFISEHAVGADEWKRDLRRFVADNLKSVAADLIPPKEHIELQARRVMYIVSKYWKEAWSLDLSPDRTEGCKEKLGFNKDGEIILEKLFEVELLQQKMRRVLIPCKCKGN
ncbi:unnamed protein product [Agarophyton chilense]